MKAKAAIQLSPKDVLTIKEVDLEEPRDDEVLVKLTACGVCHTDISQQRYHSHYPLLLGHEGSGIIERTGKDVKALKAGDHAILAYTHCGKCGACKADRPWQCEHFYNFFNGFREDGTSPVSYHKKLVAALNRQGSFATHCVVNQNAVVKVGKELDLKLFAPLGCGLMTGAGSVLNYFKPEANSSIAIFGTGSVGLAAVMAAKIAGCSPIIAVDLVPMRLDMAMELGATHCINSALTGDIADEIRKITEGVDYAFDNTGNPKVLSTIRKVLNHDGKAAGVTGDYIHFNKNELNEGKSFEETDAGFSTPQEFIPKLINYYNEGLFPFDRLIKFYDFEKINDAFEASKSGEVIKPVVVF